MNIYVLAHSLKRTRMKRRLFLSDLPRFVSDNGFSGLEISDRQIIGFSPEILDRISRFSRESRCGVILDINVDFTLSEPNELDREIQHAKAMITAASRLGAELLRICLGGQALSIQKIFRRHRNAVSLKGKFHTFEDIPPKFSYWREFIDNRIMRLSHSFREHMPARIRNLEEKRKQAVHALHQLSESVEEKGLRLGIENHWGISGDPETIIRIIQETSSPNIGTCPDMGNFPRGIDPEAGLRMMAPFALILHAKSYSFSPEGNETRIDYARFLPIFQDTGFRGPITVEYEGWGDDIAGCCLTRDLIRRHWNDSGNHRKN